MNTVYVQADTGRAAAHLAYQPIEMPRTFAVVRSPWLHAAASSAAAVCRPAASIEARMWRNGNGPEPPAPLTLIKKGGSYEPPLQLYRRPQNFARKEAKYCRPSTSYALGSVFISTAQSKNGGRLSERLRTPAFSSYCSVIAQFAEMS